MVRRDESRGDLSDGAARVVAAVSQGAAGELLSPVVVPGPEGTARRGAPLAGRSDARAVAAVLSTESFAPVGESLDRILAWCRARECAAERVLRPDILAVENGDLFGPLLRDLLWACALGPVGTARAYARRRTAQYTRFLGTFLRRLRRDLDGPGWPADDGFAGPVVRLRACDGETHHGGQRVLRVDLAGGRAVAYKPRPASGEALFLDPEDSVFALLDALPPASGAVRLPLLRCWTGSGEAGYSWQEWVEPAAEGVVREDDGVRLTGPVLGPRQAERFWHGAGALAAVCFAFGIADLHADNVVTGIRRGGDEPLLYPVDLESYFTATNRLSGTGLVRGFGTREHHHVGLENEARWCAPEGPAMYWRRNPDGTPELQPRTRPMTRAHASSVVADTAGRAGYAAYLAALLRGMFDAWTLLDRHRSRVRTYVEHHRADHVVRIVPRSTTEYLRALHRGGGDRGGGDRGDGDRAGFRPAEIAQLERGDVPYFFRTADGGPVCAVAAPSSGSRAEEVDLAPEGPGWPPVREAFRLERVTLSTLGVALRDAVEHVFDDLEEAERDDRTYGVRFQLEGPGEGQVSFSWPEADRRITYRWDRHRVRVRIEEPTAPRPEPLDTAAGRVRRRLRRLDRVDSVLRASWAESGWADAAVERKLRRLTDTGLAWLEEVVATHGWPGRAMVGAYAAGAACRLVQHAEGRLAFRRRCLELVRAAAETGDMPDREVAYLTDTLRLAEGRRQVYGTKFGRVGDLLAPEPLEDAGDVDRRRAAVGLEPLAEYARCLETAFRIPATGTCLEGTETRDHRWEP